MIRPEQTIEAMELLGIQLDYLVPDISYMHDAAEGEVRLLEQEITYQLDRARVDLDYAEAAYAQCMSTPIYNEDGEAMAPSCDYEAERVSKCGREVYRLEDLLSRLQNAMEEFLRTIREVQHLQTDTIPKSRTFLKGRITALEKFDRDIVQVGGVDVVLGSTSVVDRAAAVTSVINMLASPKVQAKINQAVGEYGEIRGVQFAKAIGSQRAGTGLKYSGNHGVDVYGLRNTPRGRSLIVVEVKTTADPSKRGAPSEVMRLLKQDRRGYQQASRAYSNHRVREAAMRDNRLARHIRSQIAHGKIRQTLNYVHWVNLATGAENTYRAISNRRGDKVQSLHFVRR